jgi:hypothetical protein
MPSWWMPPLLFAKSEGTDPDYSIVSSRSQALPLSRLSDYPDLQQMHEAWAAVSGDRVPARLEPTAIPPRLLPSVMLLDYVSDPPGLPIRLAGTALCDRFGGELRGRLLNELVPPAIAGEMLENARASADAARPGLAAREFSARNGSFWSYVRLILPLARTGDAVDGFVLAVQVTPVTRPG